MNKYDYKIDTGICPYCDENLVTCSDNYYGNPVCFYCGVWWKFIDDVNGGSYSATNIKGGRMWKYQKLFTLLTDLEFVVETSDDDNLWKAYNLIKEELDKLKLEKVKLKRKE